jgi:ATP-dependent protease ClpP protease subunit
MAQQSDTLIIESLKDRLLLLEKKLDSDIITLLGPIMYGVEQRIFRALNSIPTDKRRKNLTIILQTPGGVVEVVERMVHAIRYHHIEI